MCDFCEERDIIEHPFFRCIRLNSFWSDISKKLDVKLKKSIVLNETSIILSIEQEQQGLTIAEQKFINTIIVLGKLSIIKNKINRINIDTIFERELKIREVEL